MIQRYALGAAFLLSLFPVSAMAHAHLSKSVPSENAIVAPPPQVTLEFSQALEKRFSMVQVLDSAGKRVDDGPVGQGEGPSHLGVGLPKLAAGIYKVVWHVTSVDTHRTEGGFTFTVAP